MKKFEVTLTDEDMALARSLGEQIHYKSSRRGRFYKDGAEENVVGAVAEVAFSKLTGLPVNEVLYKGGDGGVDFSFHYRDRQFNLDVKGFRFNDMERLELLVKTNEFRYTKADIAILAVIEGRKVTFVGWETMKVMQKQPVKDHGRGIVAHFKHNKELREMERLFGAINPGLLT